MNRDLYFLAHKLICLCAIAVMLMKFMEILVRAGARVTVSAQDLSVTDPYVEPP